MTTPSSLIPEPAVPSQALSLVNVGQLMAAAIDKGIDVRELVELHRQLKADAAEEAFNHAMQQFQRDCPIIDHNERADVESRRGGTGYSYTFASLPHIVKTIKPTLEACGLTYSFDTKVDGGLITVTCTIHHVQGHSRTSKFEAAASGAPGMSEIQKFASTTTYGQRYALKLALGLMTVDMDDDGRGAPAAAHPNPSENESAPRAPSREQRKNPPKAPDDPRLEGVRKLFRTWLADQKQNNPSLPSDPDERMRAFANWCRVHSQVETFDPFKPDLWGPDEVEAFERCQRKFEG